MVENEVKRVLGIVCVQDGAGVIASEGVGGGVVGFDQGGEDKRDRERYSRTGRDFAAAGAVAGPDFRGFLADGARKGWRDGDGHDLGRGDADGHDSGMGDGRYQECGGKGR